jgi:signal transduction histidine kinase
MQERPTDPELPRLLQTAGWLWLGYLAALAVLDLLIYQRIGLASFYLVNGASVAIFLPLAYWQGFSRWLKRLHLPLMLVLIAGLPLVANHLLLPGLRPAAPSSPESMALRQLPVLFIALVITAWQYGLGGVILFSGGTALLELLIVAVVSPLIRFLFLPQSLPPQRFTPIPFRTIDIFVILALVRTISFIVAGTFISQLMDRLHRQQKSLEEANTRLTHYASTLESLTVSRERNRLAHELHDTLAHSLTAISVQLEAAKAYWSVDRKNARRLLDESLAATRSGVEETRRALKALRASPLEDLGLRLALRQLAEGAAARGGLALRLDLPEQTPSLAPDVEQVIYRIAQEALENAVNHAGAKHLDMQLEVSVPAIRLSVADDGIGFDPDREEAAGHFGLRGMRERAQLAGGQLAVESKPGRGTTVRLTIGAAV